MTVNFVDRVPDEFGDTRIGLGLLLYSSSMMRLHHALLMFCESFAVGVLRADGIGVPER
jgi:hypothetical protein